MAKNTARFILHSFPFENVNNSFSMVNNKVNSNVALSTAGQKRNKVSTALVR